MDKREEFKEFLSKNDYLADYIRKKEMTMQDFYQLYDVYGENSDIWNKYKKSTYNVGDLTKVFKNINVENIEHHVNNAQKVINVIQELSKKTPEIKSIVEKPITKFFGD